MTMRGVEKWTTQRKLIDAPQTPVILSPPNHMALRCTRALSGAGSGGAGVALFQAKLRRLAGITEASRK